jgi:hypothetical protein
MLGTETWGKDTKIFWAEQMKFIKSLSGVTTRHRICIQQVRKQSLKSTSTPWRNDWSNGVAIILNLDTGGGWVATFTSRPLVSRGKRPRYPLNKTLDSPRVGFDTPANSRFSWSCKNSHDSSVVELLALSLYQLSYYGSLALLTKHKIFKSTLNRREWIFRKSIGQKSSKGIWVR